jgi:DNA-directed RNA polymerase subunit beta'
VIKVGGHETTLGRLRVEEVLPAAFRETGKRPVKDMAVLDSKRTKALLSRLGKEHAQDYGQVTNSLTQLGNEHTYKEAFSIGLDDFAVVDKVGRDRILAAGNRRADALVRSGKRRTSPEVLAELTQASNQVDQRVAESLAKNPTNIYQMVTSGSRGSKEQLGQIVSTPGLVKNAKDQVVPFLVPNSYSEGLDTSAYWVTLQGARKGTLQKTQGVAMPGYMTRLMVNSTVDHLITEDDCGTKDGVKLGIDDGDVLDRYLSHSVKLGGKSYAPGTIVSPHLVSLAKKEKKLRLDVRSPTRCQSENGICKKCMGLSENGRSYDIGDNVGVVAAQAIGEPSTQLSLNVFHQGGLAKGRGSDSIGTFKRLQEILTLNTGLPFMAPLAPVSGAVTSVKKSDRGGHDVVMGGKTMWVPPSQDLKVKAGQRVVRGSPLSTGPQNPQDVLNLRGLHPMQDYITDEINNVLKTAAPVKRRNIEVVVKAMTDITQIEDAGDHPDWVPGDIRPVTKVNAWNRKAARAGKKSVQHEPQVKGVNLLPQELNEDWLARLNFTSLTSSLTQAFREGWKSNIHGFHPIPGLAVGSEFGKTKGRVEDWKGQY